MSRQIVLCKDCEAWKRDGADGICQLTHPVPRILPSGPNLTYTIVWGRTRADQGCCEGIPYVGGSSETERNNPQS